MLDFRLLAGIGAIVLLAILVYIRSLSGGFILDDDKLLTENELIKASNGLYRFWCTTESQDYWPVANSLLWIEWRLWGNNPTGYRVTNLILHILEALLIWLILRKLSLPGAYLAALIFVLHPVNVESVAWISQRKGLMAMLFFLLSILWYLKFEKLRAQVPGLNQGNDVNRPLTTVHHPLFYWLSLLAFLLAMLSKGSVAVLPLLLLGIVWWRRSLTRWDLVRTAPFFVVSLVLVGVNVWFQTHGTQVVIRTASFAERLLAAGGVIWFYLYKALWPLNLVFIYPQWHIDTGNPWWWLPSATAIVVTIVLWLYRKGWSRALLFAWGFFCVSLVPVLGFTDVGFMHYSLVADHYQHVAIIGVIALASVLWSTWQGQKRGAAYWAATVIAINAIGILIFLTWRQNELYHDAMTLYQATLEKNPDCYIAHHNLGNALTNAGRTQEAIEHLEQALKIKPDFPEAHYNLGNTQAKAGRTQEAIEHFKQAIRLNPEFAEAHYNLGSLLDDQARTVEAIEHYQQAIKLNPNYVDAYNNLGLALFQAGRLREASAPLMRAIELKPDYLNAYLNLILVYSHTNRSAQAIAAAQKALELARSQGQTQYIKQLEDWLDSYRAGETREDSK